MLGDQGADVIKVEGLDGRSSALTAPTTPATTSHLPDEQSNSIFEVMNRNKRSIAIDLGQERRGVPCSASLLATADGFIECFGPGVLGGGRGSATRISAAREPKARSIAAG